MLETVKIAFTESIDVADNNMTKFRIEQDSMGQVKVPAIALYGAQTQRAIDNFPISGWSMPESFIRALLLVKAAASTANKHLEVVDHKIADAIIQAVNKLLADKDIMDSFPVDVFQTGSGTSTHMNVNEVIANTASRLINKAVHPNDDVNLGQSSNDAIPTAIHVSAVIELHRQLIPSLTHLSRIIREKASALTGIIKTGRTHLMDAMPIAFSQSLGGWAAQVEQNVQSFNQLIPALSRLVMGGTAIGTRVNSHRRFPEIFNRELSKLTGLEFTPAENFIAGMAAQDQMVLLSGHLKTTAVMLTKIANDLRLMNSGPLSGFADIQLKAVQPGSSIMPAKVNPVIPEAVAMTAAQVMGNDYAVTIAGQSGQCELNTMLPLIAYNILTNIRLLTNASRLLADKAICNFTVNTQKLREHLNKNPILVTALNPIIGYEKAAMIAKRAYAENRTVIDVAREMTDLSENELERLLNPVALTEPFE